MRTTAPGVVLLVLLLLAPGLHAQVSTAAVHERWIHRLAAGPGPALLPGFFDDMTSYRVEIPEGVSVRIWASANATDLFVLRVRDPEGVSSTTLPASAQAHTLGRVGAWEVHVDPVAGARVEIRVLFQGFVGDSDGGAPAAFALTDLGSQPGCWAYAGVCLP